MELGVQPRYV
ncbi:Protein of unknown function [Bacillus mycoides]|uniref:Uncharacterized protein n=1 Tax=Bacillus mycoides TaxID=1405 RepID=A0A1G4EPZ0_BACMY|nr:Protein of unknown function [Bacillus mycoides]